MLRQTASILVKVQGSCPKVFPLLLGGLGNHSALATIMSLILVVYCLDKNSLFKQSGNLFLARLPGFYPFRFSY